MSFLYITADQVGIETGGGIVTHHESQALRELGPCEVWGREQLAPVQDDPWGWDARANAFYHGKSWKESDRPQLAHVYAGTFSRTVESLKFNRCRVAYTAAAHDVTVSRKAHEELGLPYDYPHITQPELWARYVRGYLEADVLVCPSQHSADVMRGFGAKNRIEVIPHGCEMPKCREGGDVDCSDYPWVCRVCNGTGTVPIAPLPSSFVVGAFGAISGPDKGLIDLLRAWAKLKHRDALLVLGGSHSSTPWVRHLIEISGASNVVCTGWLDDPADFYNQISLLVQPSRSEGFGIEVLEAMAYGRAVISSTGAGGCDVLPCDGHWQAGTVFPPGDVEGLADRIDAAKKGWNLASVGKRNRVEAEKYTWPIIRKRYQNLWRELLNEKGA